MYAPGEIRLLCELARPRVGVVTNVGPVHLERLGSIEAIAAAKAELVEALPADGFARAQRRRPARAGDGEEDEGAGRCSSARRTAATCGEAISRAKGWKAFPFTLEYGGESLRVRTRLPGRHLLPNALGAAAVALVEGMGFGRSGAGSRRRSRSAATARLPRPQRLDDPRRHVQRQPGFDARGAGAAGRPAGSADSGPGRHARAGRRGAGRASASSDERRRAWRR